MNALRAIPFISDEVFDNAVKLAQEYSAREPDEQEAQKTANKIVQESGARNRKEVHSFLLKRAKEIEYVSPPNKAWLWSFSSKHPRTGTEISNRFIAEAYSIQNSEITLEQTTGGRYLDDLRLFSRTVQEQLDIGYTEVLDIWQVASTNYVEAIRGPVCAMAPGKHPLSILASYELERLRHNPDVPYCLLMDREPHRTVAQRHNLRADVARPPNSRGAPTPSGVIGGWPQTLAMPPSHHLRH